MTDFGANQRIVFVNDSAGSHTDVPKCLQAFKRCDIADAADVLPPLLTISSDASQLLVAVWGGDGSIRSVAARLVDSQATLLACPGGTHNHFCRQLGMSNEADVAAALTSGAVRHLDVGKVGPEIFLNNLSIGWYTDLVYRRVRYEAHMPRRLAKATSLAVQLFRTRRLRLVIDGTPERTWLFWAGNGEYATTPARLNERESLDQGVLDVRLLRAGTRWPKVRALIALARKNTESSPLVDRRVIPSTSVNARQRTLQATLDGELISLNTPLQITVGRGSLRVLTPVNP